MVLKRRSNLGSPAVKLGVFAVVLAVALGGGVLAGAAFGPAPETDTPPVTTDVPERSSADADELPAGLAISRDGYTLDLRTPVVESRAPLELVFVIEGPDGRPLTDYSIEHDKELHLVVVGRDSAGYAHMHPTRGADGVWAVTAPALAPGSYRVLADFVPAGGGGLTLGADLTVPGDHQPTPLPAPSGSVTVAGYDVSFAGELVGGSKSEVTVTVTRGGEPVTNLQPYLGALGHLVAIRYGDLAYLHVHPLDAADRAGGPQVRFAVEVPTAGVYGLYFDFAADGEVRTASVIADAAGITRDADVDTTADHSDSHGG